MSRGSERPVRRRRGAFSGTLFPLFVPWNVLTLKRGSRSAYDIYLRRRFNSRIAPGMFSEQRKCTWIFDVRNNLTRARARVIPWLNAQLFINACALIAVLSKLPLNANGRILRKSLSLSLSSVPSSVRFPFSAEIFFSHGPLRFGGKRQLISGCYRTGMINDEVFESKRCSLYNERKVSDVSGKAVYFENRYFRIGLPLFINVKLSHRATRADAYKPPAACLHA